VGAEASPDLPRSLYIRYYGDAPKLFDTSRNFPQDVCEAFQAMCEVVTVGQCKTTLDEFAMPYADDSSPQWRQGAKGQGYFTFEVNATTGESRLWSGCSPGCTSCSNGLVLQGLTEGDQGLCRATPNRAVYQLKAGASSSDKEVCVRSLSEYHGLLAVREDRYRLVVSISGGVLVFLVCFFCTASAMMTPKRPPTPKIITVQEIERAFPAKRGAAARRRAGTAHCYADHSTIASATPAGSPGTASKTDVGEDREEHVERQTSEQELTCAVCLMVIAPDELFRELQCDHCFHADCIVQWWTHVPRATLQCPTCRHLQTVEDLEGPGLDSPKLVATEATASEAVAEQESSTCESGSADLELGRHLAQAVPQSSVPGRCRPGAPVSGGALGGSSVEPIPAVLGKIQECGGLGQEVKQELRTAEIETKS